MSRCGASVMRTPTKPAPISPESPMPKIVSASPVATWLTAKPQRQRREYRRHRRAGDDAAERADEASSR